MAAPVFSIVLKLADSALRHAVAEQLKPLADLREEWGESAPDLVLCDADNLARLPTLYTGRLFLIGPARDGAQDTKPPETSGRITETFALPLRLGHLIGRVQIHMQAARQMPDSAHAVGPYQFYPKRKYLVPRDAPDAAPHSLTEKESLLLAHLLDAEGPVHRDELLAAIWGYDGRMDTHTLETHIYRLRSVPGLRDLFTVEQSQYRIVRDKE